MVADAPKDDPGREDLSLVGRNRANSPLRVGFETVGNDLDALDLLLTEDRHWRDTKAEANRARLSSRLAGCEVAEHVDVPPNERRRGLELGGARRVQLELGGVDDDVGFGELPELRQLGRGPRRLDRATPAEHDDLANAGARDRLDRRIGGIRAGELVPREREHPRHVESDVPVPDDHGTFDGKVELKLLEVRVAVVPGDELRGRPGAGKILSRDSQVPVGLRADRVHDGVVCAHELVVRHVPPDFDIAEEAEPGTARDLLEGARHLLQLRMIRCDPEPHEPPRGRQPLDHVHLSALRRVEQMPGRVEGRRPGAHDRNAQSSSGTAHAVVNATDALEAGGRATMRPVFRRMAPKVAAFVGAALLVVVLAVLAKAWYDSRLPGTYSVMAYGDADYGGGSSSGGPLRTHWAVRPGSASPIFTDRGQVDPTPASS